METRIIGLYHNTTKGSLATIGRATCSCLKTQWFVTRSESINWDQYQERTRRLMFDNNEDFNQVRMYLNERGYYPVNKVVVLVHEDDYEKVMKNEDLIEKLCCVFGPEAFSIVRYRQFINLELIELDIPYEQHSWVWYGSKVDPALEHQLVYQSLRNMEKINDLMDRDFSVHRLTEMGNQLYLFNDFGEIEEF